MDTVVFTILHQITPVQSEQFVAILWIVCKRRNLKLWQQSDGTNMQAIECATHLMEEWRLA